MEISAVILAGGKSSRMGKDKALLPFKNSPSLTKYQHDKLSEIFSKVYISAKENKFCFKANLILDKTNNYSPLYALHTIASEIKEDAFFLIAVDMPLISNELILKLINLYKKNSSYDAYVFKTSSGLEPTAAIYTKKILPELKEQINKKDFKLMNFIEKLNLKIVRIDMPSFTNLNNYNDYLSVIKK